MRRLPLAALLAACPLGCTLAARGQAPTLPGTVTLAPQVVSATRTPTHPINVAATVKLLEGDALRHAPAVTLDGALRSVPAFSLFRRSDSFSANPTAQGVSLRGLGPSGASRSLVLLDGVPLNDPFGGWVAWTKLPRETVSAVELVPGGGATAWGNAALGGVLQILGPPPAQAGTRASATLGDYGTRSFEFAHTLASGADHLQLGGRAFGTDGFTLVAPERRGPIDIAAWSRHRWLAGGWRHAFGKRLAAGATFRVYEEKRANGTPYQRNGSRERFLSLNATGHPADAFTWNAVAYAQDQSFASTFSAVNATRTAETPASDQFAVPATALGAAWSGGWSPMRDARTSFGGDARFVRGETRENFTFAAGNFTRQRIAGGRQFNGGAFALHERDVIPELRGVVGARVDTWQDTDGHRRETDRATGAVLRNDRYADRNGTELSPSAGLIWLPSMPWRLRANVQRAFRRPTLNELHRPFRVGPNVTEANAALRTERNTSAELGAEWTLFSSKERPQAPQPPARPGEVAALYASQDMPPERLLTLGATLFTNELRDAVGNVTIARGPGTFPIVGFIAAGGVGRQRLNLDRTRVRGVELSAKWTPVETLTVTGDYLYNDATVTRAAIAPALVGRRLAQVPRKSAALGATWRAPRRFTLTPRLRWLGRQFEDDENQLVLGEVVIADLAVSRPVGEHLEVFVSVENLGNARIETGRTADGLVNIGTPRLAMFGLRGSW